MKICIPTLGEKGFDEQVSEHFGSAPYFTIIDLESNRLEIINNQNQHHRHGQCHPMRTLNDRQISGVICSGVGRRAVELLNADGVKVYLGNGNTVKETIEQYQQGNLKELTVDCACGGHDHGHSCQAHFHLNKE
jgi:predicted Fe-Mo cluster-binding NifX family protein